MLLLVSGALLFAQEAPRVDRSREQTDFGAEGDFQRPTPIQAEALKALRMSNGDDDLLRCAEQEGIPVAEIPARWFVASEIRLSRTSASGLVVRAEDACLGGAHIAQFWVLAKSSAGYSIVFRERMGWLSLRAGRMAIATCS
jgi:hypothetical protein